MDNHRISRNILALFIATLFLFGCSVPSANIAHDSSIPNAETITRSQPITTKSKTLSKAHSKTASSSTSESVTQPATVPITQAATATSTTPALTKSTVSTQALANTNSVADSQIKASSSQSAKKSNSTSTKSSFSEKATSPSYKTLSSSGNLEVHFLDVGQGDSILIKLPNKQTMLIDAGEASRGTGVVNYIKSKNIKKLDYVVATHPHADHIGGMAQVINTFPIDRFIMPRKEHTTKTFERMLDALIARDVKVTEAKAGVSILKSQDLDIRILGPSPNLLDSNLNNHSAIVKITYLNNSFLFVGDAEQKALAKIPKMNLDVLKMGHHGSDTSSSLSFLKKVSPQHSVISVGKNQYGHPNQSTLNNLSSVGCRVYRTDQAGTIIVTSDGKTISVNASPSAIVASKSDKPTTKKSNTKPPTTKVKKSTSTKKNTTKPPLTKVKKTKPTTTKPQSTKPPSTKQSENKERTVYGTKTGKKYHENGCRHLSKSKIPMSLDKAIKKGLTPCKVCH